MFPSAHKRRRTAQALRAAGRRCVRASRQSLLLVEVQVHRRTGIVWAAGS